MGKLIQNGILNQFGILVLLQRPMVEDRGVELVVQSLQREAGKKLTVVVDSMGSKMDRDSIRLYLQENPEKLPMEKVKLLWREQRQPLLISS